MNRNEKTLQPLVSVIVPVYNVERYLTEALGSVLTQTLTDIEVICVNDGSTDDSLAVLETIAREDPRVQIINQENRGLSEARNSGVRFAKGKYLYFMDSDDMIEPETLELCVTDMEQRNLEYVCFNTIAFGDDPKCEKPAESLNRSYFRRTLDETEVYTGRELMRDLIRRNSFVVTAWSCVLLRSAFLENNLWFHPRIVHEDEPWMVLALLSFSRCGCINKILYHNRIRSGSITQSALTFSYPYGLFAGSDDIRNYLEKHPHLLLNDDCGQIEIERAKWLQKRAIGKYRACREEEKQKRIDLNPEKRVLFEQMVAYPAELEDRITKISNEKAALQTKQKSLEEQNAALTEKQKELQGQIKKLQWENRKLKNNISRINASRSYRIGRMITRPGRAIKLFINGK